MKARGRVVACAGALLLIFAASAEAQMKVLVDDSTPGTVGSRLSFAVKERIRKSSGFALVTSEKEALFRFGLVTLDDKSGYSTVYSVVFTAWQPQTGTWTYLNNIVGTCGTNRIEECADGLVADADKSADIPREFYKTYFQPQGKSK